MNVYQHTQKREGVLCLLCFFLFSFFFFSPFLSAMLSLHREHQGLKQATASAIDVYNRTVLVINYSNELVSRVQALNTGLVTVAIAPDHQESIPNPGSTRERGRISFSWPYGTVSKKTQQHSAQLCCKDM